MLGADVLRCVMQALTAVFLFSGRTELWPLIVLSALYGAGDAFFQPAVTGLVPETVRPDRIQQANALLSMTRNGCWLAGPVVAGVVVSTASPGWAFAVDAATFAVSAAFLAADARCRGSPAWTRSPSSAELRAGWREVTGRTWVWTGIAYFAVWNLALAPHVRARAVRGRGIARRRVELGGDRHLRRRRVAGRSGRRASSEAEAAARDRLPPLRPRRARAGAAGAAVPDGGRRGGRRDRLRRECVRERALVHDAAGADPRGSISRVSAYDWLGSIVFKPAGYAFVGPLVAALGTRSTLLACAAVIAAASVVVSSLGGVRAVVRPGEIPETADRLSLS